MRQRAAELCVWLCALSHMSYGNILMDPMVAYNFRQTVIDKDYICLWL